MMAMGLFGALAPAVVYWYGGHRVMGGEVTLGTVVGLDAANEGGNVPAIANILFSKYVFAFEATSALLITAAIGAMVLAHRERLTPKATQASLAAQRIRDFGVRRALGASTSHVMALVAGNALWVIGLGAAAGLVLSYLVGRLIATMLFGVRPSDPLTFAFVAIVMTVGALLSTIGPAWRAARIEPASALRRE